MGEKDEKGEKSGLFACWEVKKMKNSGEKGGIFFIFFRWWNDGTFTPVSGSRRF